MRIVPRVLSAAIAAALIASPAFASELTGTLKKIKDSGTITLGHRDASIPFSYFGDNPQQPVGYSHDLQLKVVDAIKQGDAINKITLEGDTDAVLAAKADRVAEWNRYLSA